MQIKELLRVISAKPVRVKEILKEIENLNENHDDLALFLRNNQNLGISEFDVASQLMINTTNFIDKRISLNVTKNIYDQYSIIYTILMLSVTNKTESNKLAKIYYDVVTNTSRFDLYVKPAKNVRKISGDSTILELFWLIPLFSNVTVLTNLDYSKFISEMKVVSGANEEFPIGYSHYVTSDVFGLDKPAYKQFLTEGTKK